MSTHKEQMQKNAIKLNDKVSVRTLQGRDWQWVTGKIESIKKDGVMVIKDTGERRFVGNHFINLSIAPV